MKTPKGTLRNIFGFTLIELLVVMAVISILLAVIFPAISKAKSRCRLLKCQSNLRQIGMAWDMYLIDFGEFLQGTNMQRYFGGISQGVGDLRPLNEYLKGNVNAGSSGRKSVFYCPGDTTRNNLRPKVFFDGDGTSYQANEYLVGQELQSGRSTLIDGLKKKIQSGLPRAAVSTNPASLLFMGDTHWRTEWTPIEAVVGAAWHDKPSFYNISFLDGHVGFVNIRKGIYISANYSLIPFKELNGLARSEQEAWEEWQPPQRR